MLTRIKSFIINVRLLFISAFFKPKVWYLVEKTDYEEFVKWKDENNDR